MYKALHKNYKKNFDVFFLSQRLPELCYEDFVNKSNNSS